MADNDKALELEKAKFELEKSVAAGKVELEAEKKKVVELESVKVTLEKKVTELEGKALETEVDKLISIGKVTPAQKDFALEMMKSNRVAFEKFVEGNTGAPIGNGVKKELEKNAGEQKWTAEKIQAIKTKEEFEKFLEDTKIAPVKKGGK